MVCTGNICRSPAMHYLAARDWAESADVRSAGTYAELGLDATKEMRRAAAEYDLTFPRHRPTQLDARAIDAADLVLVATETHFRWIQRELGMSPAHVFGIRQAAELARRAPKPAGDTPAERLKAVAKTLLAEHRREAAPLRSLDDPWGHSQAVYERVMGEIVADLGTLTAWAELR